MIAKKWSIITCITILLIVIISYNHMSSLSESTLNEINETKKIPAIQKNNTISTTPTINLEKENIQQVTEQYFQKINQQMPEEISKLFTSNGKLMHYYYGNKSIIGQTEITKTYTLLFQEDPTFKIEVENITVNKIQSNQAIVTCERIRLGKMRDISPNSVNYTFQMIKLNGSWKINEAIATMAPSINAPKLVNLVIIDGKWTTANEWNDAQEYPMEYNIYNKYKNNGTSYLRIKHDQKYLYILLDIPSHTTPTRAFSNIYIDPAGNGGWKPQPDDYCYSFFGAAGGEYKIKFIVKEEKWNFHHFSGITNNEIRSNMAYSSNSTNNPYSEISHAIYEYRIPLPDKKTMRILVDALDQDHNSYTTWPGKVWNDTPELWGKIIISN